MSSRERPIRTRAGAVLLQVTAEGYQPFRRQIDLPGGGAKEMSVELVSRSTSGILMVRTNIPNARIVVDGKAIGEAPVESVALAGTHTVEADRPGYNRTSTSVVVQVGEQRHAPERVDRRPRH